MIEGKVSIVGYLDIDPDRRICGVFVECDIDEAKKAGPLFGDTVVISPPASQPNAQADACPKCGGKLSFGLSGAKWVCTKCGIDNRTA